MKEYFEKFENMKAKKLLIVDDTQADRDRFSKLAQRDDLEIILAENVQEGTQKALAERPDIIITDKDMPDGTGNDLAKAVKNVYDAKIAGITGGNPDDFQEDVVDIRESKSISDNRYQTLVKVLVESNNPKEDYAKATGKYITDFVKVVGEVVRGDYTAVDILVQGYDVATRLQQGKSPFEDNEIDVELRTPTEEESRDFFDLEDVGVNAEELYKSETEKLKRALEGTAEKNSLYQAVESFVNDERIDRFFQNIIQKDHDAIQTNQDYSIFHEKFKKIIEEYSNEVNPK